MNAVSCNTTPRSKDYQSVQIFINAFKDNNEMFKKKKNFVSTLLFWRFCYTGR